MGLKGFSPRERIGLIILGIIVLLLLGMSYLAGAGRFHKLNSNEDDLHNKPLLENMGVIPEDSITAYSNNSKEKTSQHRSAKRWRKSGNSKSDKKSRNSKSSNKSTSNPQRRNLLNESVQEE